MSMPGTTLRHSMCPEIHPLKPFPVDDPPTVLHGTQNTSRAALRAYNFAELLSVAGVCEHQDICSVVEQVTPNMKASMMSRKLLKIKDMSGT